MHIVTSRAIVQLLYPLILIPLPSLLCLVVFISTALSLFTIVAFRCGCMSSFCSSRDLKPRVPRYGLCEIVAWIEWLKSPFPNCQPSFPLYPPPNPSSLILYNRTCLNLRRLRRNPARRLRPISQSTRYVGPHLREKVLLRDLIRDFGTGAHWMRLFVLSNLDCC